MWIIYLIVVAVFIWLVFNVPLKKNPAKDTYEDYLRRAEVKRERADE